MRPFGVSMVVCGLDGNCGGGGRMIVCVTDPSGVISSYRYGGGGGESVHSTDEGDNKSFDRTDVIVIGGEEKTKALLRQQLVERLHRSSSGTITDNDVDTEPMVIRETNEDRYARILRQYIRATVEALARLPSTTGVGGVGGSGSSSSVNPKPSNMNGGG